MLVRPDTNSQLLRAKLSLGVGHNSYGEQAWPNDLLYMHPISSFGILGAVIGLACLSPTRVWELANPYATPYEILPESILFPTAQITRDIQPKLLGITGIAALRILPISSPFLESSSRFQRRMYQPKKQAKKANNLLV